EPRAGYWVGAPAERGSEFPRGSLVYGVGGAPEGTFNATLFIDALQANGLDCTRWGLALRVAVLASFRTIAVHADDRHQRRVRCPEHIRLCHRAAPCIHCLENGAARKAPEREPRAPPT